MHTEQLRCGFEENTQLQEGINELLTKWVGRNPTYWVKTTPSSLPSLAAEAELDYCFARWSSFSSAIKFVKGEKGGLADIICTTGRGARENFDGQGRTLAYAGIPQGDNQFLYLKFDDDEQFTIDKPTRPNEIYFRAVAMHEIGHIVGLLHSKLQTALMYPFYTPDISEPQANDDIPRFLQLYPGPIPNTPVDPTVPPVPQGNRLVMTSAIPLEIVLNGRLLK